MTSPPCHQPAYQAPPSPPCAFYSTLSLFFLLLLPELKDVIAEYSVPTNLHPRLPPLGLTMDKLLSRRVVPDAMPWRHLDTDVRDDFPNNYNEEHVERLAAPVVPLRPPPRHLLYLKTKELVHEDQRPPLHVTPPLTEGQLLPEKSLTQIAVEKPNAKIVAAREKKDKQNLAKARSKHAREESSMVGYTKRAPKNQEVTNSGSDKTISTDPLRHARPNIQDEIATSAPNAAVSAATGGSHAVDLECEVVNLSESTRIPTPSVIFVVPPPPHIQPDPSAKRVAHSDEEGGSSEMITHLATPAEDEYLRSLSSVELLEELNRLRKNLQKEMQANSELSKQFTLLDSAYSSCEDKKRKLMDQLKDMEKEMDDWRGTASRQVERIRVLEGELGSKSQQLTVAEERVQALEGENNKLVSHLAQAEMKRYKLVWEFISDVDQIAVMLPETQNVDVNEARAWKDKHRELFSAQYPFIQKVVESYRLPMDQLLQVSPDLPSLVDASTGPSTEVNVGNVSVQPPLDAHTAEATSEPPFKHAL
ncbi:hypothetical protein Tco_0701939 [Tanacetum coccineum]|uniref:Uncharacterized protein n=1 Tax=Tanacetum coccineum TaxID=301880 RepID=A0ABQ4XW36_9ASTR